MTSKFDGSYTYQNDPLSTYYRIDKKFLFDAFEGRTIVALEIPDTADFHCEVEKKTKDGRKGVWLRSHIITPDECAEIYNQASSRVALQNLYDKEFPNVDVAFGGFCLDHSKWPTYSNAGRKPNFLISDIFVNQRWMDHDIVVELCKKYGVYTLPVIFEGVATEDFLMGLLDTPSKISKNETIHGLFVKSPYESLEDKWATSRKFSTIIEKKAFFSSTPKVIQAAAKVTETEEDESTLETLNLIDELSGPMESLEEVNDFINKNFDDENKTSLGAVIPINTGRKPSVLLLGKKTTNAVVTTMGETKIKILRGMLEKIFEVWKPNANAFLVEYEKKLGKKVTRELLFEIGPQLQERLTDYIKSNDKLLNKYTIMVTQCTEQTVKYEAQTICFKYVQKYLGI
jgi:hypothetical protein